MICFLISDPVVVGSVSFCVCEFYPTLGRLQLFDLVSFLSPKKRSDTMGNNFIKYQKDFTFVLLGIL